MQWLHSGLTENVHHSPRKLWNSLLLCHSSCFTWSTIPPGRYSLWWWTVFTKPHWKVNQISTSNLCFGNYGSMQFHSMLCYFNLSRAFYHHPLCLCCVLFPKDKVHAVWVRTQWSSLGVQRVVIPGAVLVLLKLLYELTCWIKMYMGWVSRWCLSPWARANVCMATLIHRNNNLNVYQHLLYLVILHILTTHKIYTRTFKKMPNVQEITQQRVNKFWNNKFRLGWQIPCCVRLVFRRWTDKYSIDSS